MNYIFDSTLQLETVCFLWSLLSTLAIFSAPFNMGTEASYVLHNLSGEMCIKRTLKEMLCSALSRCLIKYNMMFHKQLWGLFQVFLIKFDILRMCYAFLFLFF